MDNSFLPEKKAPGTRLKEIRLDRELTQLDLCVALNSLVEEANIWPGDLSKIESGHRRPTLDQCVAIQVWSKGRLKASEWVTLAGEAA